MEDREIGDQLVVFDDLALLMPYVLRDEPLVSKK
jgi:hypothetical protein